MVRCQRGATDNAAQKLYLEDYSRFERGDHKAESRKGRAMENEKIVVRADPYLAEEVPWYLGQLGEFSKAINEAAERGDFKTIEDTAHGMRGSGSSFGFDAISEIGLALERSAKENNMKEVRKWSGELSSYLERVEVVYE